MKTSLQLCSASRALIFSVLLSLFAPGSLLAQVSIWTWHGDNLDDNWRTGLNAAESTLTPSIVTSAHFGQICSYGVDGQVYAQPLVLANATINTVNYSSVVYVATQNDSVYLFDGTNCSLIASAVTGTGTSLIPSTEIAVLCGSIGSGGCGTIKPKVGILGTPVIDENTNHIYLVTYSTDGTTFYHRVHALFTGLVSGTTALAEDTTYTNGNQYGVTVSSGSFSPSFSSATHIQRPGCLRSLQMIFETCCSASCNGSSSKRTTFRS
jgi:hypothetical protein